MAAVEVWCGLSSFTCGRHYQAHFWRNKTDIFSLPTLALSARLGRRPPPTLWRQVQGSTFRPPTGTIQFTTIRSSTVIYPLQCIQPRSRRRCTSIYLIHYKYWLPPTIASCSMSAPGMSHQTFGWGISLTLRQLQELGGKSIISFEGTRVVFGWHPQGVAWFKVQRR
jgi:hypothetical protein